MRIALLLTFSGRVLFARSSSTVFVVAVLFTSPAWSSISVLIFQRSFPAHAHALRTAAGGMCAGLATARIANPATETTKRPIARTRATRIGLLYAFLAPIPVRTARLGHEPFRS